MGKVIVKFKKVSNTKSVVTYMNGTMALMKIIGKYHMFMII